MLSELAWLALEVRYLDRARDFYTAHLDLPVVAERDGAVVLDTGGDALVLRAPGDVPRGGLHVHYALATPHDRYEAWYDDLSASFDLEEFDFGGMRSLYFDDPDGHCVEIGQRRGSDAPLGGIFEIVLEVEDLDVAVAFYRTLGFAVTDRGDDRRRVRLGGPVDLELWEPQLGIADARGGVHVDVGFTASDPGAAGDAIAGDAPAVEDVSDGVRIRDPDGHYLTVRRE